MHWSSVLKLHNNDILAAGAQFVSEGIPKYYFPYCHLIKTLFTMILSQYFAETSVELVLWLIKLICLPNERNFKLVRSWCFGRRHCLFNWKKSSSISKVCFQKPESAALNKFYKVTTPVVNRAAYLTAKGGKIAL